MGPLSDENKLQVDKINKIEKFFKIRKLLSETIGPLAIQ